MEIQLSPPKNKYPERIIAVILCAGEGTRIKNIFPSTPKPLIKVHKLGNLSILNYLISNLMNLKIDLIEIITGHLGSQIEENIKFNKEKDKLRYTNVSIIHSGNDYQIGSFFSFLSLSKKLSKYSSRDLFLILPGDTIFTKEILEEIFQLIFEKGNLFRNNPSVFYQELNREEIEPVSDRLISIIEFISAKEKLYLKKIVQIDSRIQYLGRIKQIVPILAIPYKYIVKLINQAKKINVTSLREMLNFLTVTQDQKIMVYELNSKYRFYDIDSESDLINFEKKMDNSCSD